MKEAKKFEVILDYLEKYILPQLERNWHWVGPINSIPRVLNEIDHNRIQISLPFAKGAEKEKKFLYSNKDILSGRHSLAVSKKFKHKIILSNKALAHMRVAHHLTLPSELKTNYM